MFRRLFLFSSLFLCLIMPVFAMRTACLNSSLADLWSLAGGSVDITVQEAVDRGFADEDAIIVDSASGRNINTEILVSAEPDLVIGSVDTASHLRLKGLLDNAGIRMILLQLDSFYDFLASFKILTDITGRKDLYMQYGENQKREIKEIIKEACQIPEAPRIIFVRAGSAFSSVRAKRADDHFAAGIIEDLGAVNVADEFDALTDTLSLEALLTADIDKILVVPQGNADAGIAYVRSLFSNPGWKDIKAVKEGSVYFLDKNLFHFKPCGRWAEAYRVMKEVLYG